VAMASKLSRDKSARRIKVSRWYTLYLDGFAIIQMDASRPIYDLLDSLDSLSGNFAVSFDGVLDGSGVVAMTALSSFPGDSHWQYPK